MLKLHPLSGGEIDIVNLSIDIYVKMVDTVDQFTDWLYLKRMGVLAGHNLVRRNAHILTANTQTHCQALNL